MKSIDIKKKTNDEEYFEEADPRLFGYDEYQSDVNYNIEKFSNKYKKFKESKFYKPLLTLLPIAIFVIIVSTIVLISANKELGITSIDTTLPEVLYYDEEYAFKTDIYGEGKLAQTIVKFSTQNKDTITFKDEELVGDSLKNAITVKQNDYFHVNIEATLKGQKVTYQSNEITVCKRLDETTLENKTYTINKGSLTTYDLGLDKHKKKCLEKLEYNLSNKDIVKLDSANNTILGLNTGMTVLTVSDGLKNVNITIVVK